MIDLHAHILPSLDDGSQNIKESLKMAGQALKDGITKMVATPHLFRGKYHYDDLSIIGEKLEILKESLAKEGIDVALYRGAEVHIAHNLIDEIKAHRKYLVVNGSSYLFVEFPSDHVFHGVKNLFFELMSEGLIPIIAHPERNTVFRRTPRVLYELVQMGALCQINSGSFYGHYGIRAAQAAENFLRLNLIHFLASDCHNTHTIKPFLSGAKEKIEESFGIEVSRALVKNNPEAVLRDEPIPFHPEPDLPREKNLRIKIPWLKRNKE